MKKMVWVATVATVLSLGANAAMAEGTAVGLVDYGKIFQTSARVKKMTEQLKSEFEGRQEKIQETQKQLSQDIKKLQKDSSVMSKNDKKSLEKKISDERQLLISNATKFQSDLNQAQSKSMQTVSEDLKKIVAKVAKEKDLNLVIEKQMALFSDGLEDITGDVETEFDS